MKTKLITFVYNLFHIDFYNLVHLKESRTVSSNDPRYSWYMSNQGTYIHTSTYATLFSSFDYLAKFNLNLKTVDSNFKITLVGQTYICRDHSKFIFTKQLISQSINISNISVLVQQYNIYVLKSDPWSSPMYWLTLVKRDDDQFKM